MDSHGGVTAEDQREKLAALGVAQEPIDCWIESSIEVYEVRLIPERHVPVSTAAAAVRTSTPSASQRSWHSRTVGSRHSRWGGHTDRRPCSFGTSNTVNTLGLAPRGTSPKVDRAQFISS
jgi:hypothetical protein